MPATFDVDGLEITVSPESLDVKADGRGMLFTFIKELRVLHPEGRQVRPRIQVNELGLRAHFDPPLPPGSVVTAGGWSYEIGAPSSVSSEGAPSDFIERPSRPPALVVTGSPDEQEIRARFLGTGIVYLSETPEEDLAAYDPRFHGYWESDFDGRWTLVEQGPGWMTPEDAIAWGRSRAPRVILRTGTDLADQSEFDAGDEVDELGRLPRWVG